MHSHPTPRADSQATVLADAHRALVEVYGYLLHRCRSVTVAEDQLSLAIGKGGQNARLAAKLTGWKIDIHPASEGIKEEVKLENLEENTVTEQTEIEEADEAIEEGEIKIEEPKAEVEEVKEKKKKATKKEKIVEEATEE